MACRGVGWRVASGAAVWIMGGMIRRCEEKDFEAIYAIINEAAQAYRGVIPGDRWHEPYMGREELAGQMGEGVEFWGYEIGGELVVVMGIQDVGEVTLIRHAYVRTAKRRGGIGGRLLRHLRGLRDKPVLIGTWADAAWAVRFYEKHGFKMVSHEEKDRLLKKYWRIPERQVATSVVLGDGTWLDRAGSGGKDRAMERLAVVERDEFAKLVGVEVVERWPGRAKVRMKIRPEHLNGLGMVQGGAIFTLADLGFAAACNSHGFDAVAINVSITYLKAAKAGMLYAEAEETSPHGKLGTCTIRVTDDAGDVVALFQGLSYRKGPSGGKE